LSISESLNLIQSVFWNKWLGNHFMKPITIAPVVAAALSCSLGGAAAQKAGSIHIDVNAQLRVDCTRPTRANNFPVRVHARNTISPDKSFTANWQITSLGTESMDFSGRLGSASTVGLPGGSSAQLRVTPGNGLLLNMTSLQSSMSARVTTSGNSCNVTISTALRRGFREYSLWSGSSYYFCSQPRVTQATCRIR
jgi:hypothetical protein